MTEVTWVEAETAPKDFQLRDGVTPYDLSTGSPSLELVLKDKDGVPVPTAGDLAIQDAATGKVRFTPDATDLQAARSPYTAHIKVTKSGADYFFPGGDADVWRVSPQ